MLTNALVSPPGRCEVAAASCSTAGGGHSGNPPQEVTTSILVCHLPIAALATLDTRQSLHSTVYRQSLHSPVRHDAIQRLTIDEVSVTTFTHVQKHSFTDFVGSCHAWTETEGNWQQAHAQAEMYAGVDPLQVHMQFALEHHVMHVAVNPKITIFARQPTRH